MFDASSVWLDTLRRILSSGFEVSPRGRLTKELLQHTLIISMRRPVVTVVERKLNYQFMAAEAHWILSGDDTVAGIAPWNKNIAQFSDDGERFFGAYGPKIVGQLDYVVAKLLADQDTRQAGLTIWRENPPATKDVPCTVAIFANIRDTTLNLHVFMRSSDAWLGVPYDVFNFSMLGHLICCRLNDHHRTGEATVVPGRLYLTAASSHLYEPNWLPARECLSAVYRSQAPTPQELWAEEKTLYAWLEGLRDTKPGDRLRWWES
ncbi:pyrimidine hmase [Caudoviricetes sp.]|nr:pyrimidine hmase [Caudoviricetes sp.]